MTTKIDPAQRAASEIKRLETRLGWVSPRAMADIIRQETRCDEMRRLLAEAYDRSYTPRFSAEWINKTRELLEATDD